MQPLDTTDMCHPLKLMKGCQADFPHFESKRRIHNSGVVIGAKKSDNLKSTQIQQTA